VTVHPTNRVMPAGTRRVGKWRASEIAKQAERGVARTKQDKYRSRNMDQTRMSVTELLGLERPQNVPATAARADKHGNDFAGDAPSMLAAYSQLRSRMEQSKRIASDANGMAITSTQLMPAGIRAAIRKSRGLEAGETSSSQLQQ